MSISNVVYNINVKSKFELFLNDDFCEAEPDELVKKISNDRKKKELAHKEAKKQKHNEVKNIVPKTITEKEHSVESKLNNEKAPRLPKSDTKTSYKPKIGQKLDLPISKCDVIDESSVDKNQDKSKRSFGNNSKKVRGREFDRHSGSDKTGIKSVDRREGSGAYNWGNVKDLVNLSQEPSFTEVKEDALDENVIVQESTVETEKKEPEKLAMTISEWKALHANSTVISSHIPTRPANNGENVFTGMNAYQKKNVQHSESDSEIIIPDDDIDSKGRRQIKVNIEFSGRATRGGFNNPRFRRDERNGVAKDDVIKLDEEDFPTLS